MGYTNKNMVADAMYPCILASVGYEQSLYLKYINMYT